MKLIREDCVFFFVFSVYEGVCVRVAFLWC